MKNMTPEKMAAVTCGRLLGPDTQVRKEITEVVTDSRKIRSGCLFVAIRGEHADGHDFVGRAIRDGAGAVLAAYLPEGIAPTIPVILVGDTRKALRKLAAYYLDQMRIPTVGIIGSAGKTSTKEMVAAVLSQRFCVLKTEGNLNNELGVPLTVFRIRAEHEIAVIEMGINHFGEMTRLAEIVRPDTVVMTNIGTAHLEFLKDREGILRAKSEVFAHMRPESCAILNEDDDKLVTLQKINGNKPLFFAVERPDADIRAEHIQASGIESVQCTVVTPSERFAVRIPGSGMHVVHNALAGAAVGYRYGLRGSEIAEGIASYQSLAGRFQIKKTAKLTVIDDSYNANPSSMKASLQVLQKGEGRRVAILGDMGELGTEAPELHREVGRYAGTLDIDILYAVGTLGGQIAGGAEESAKRSGRNMTIRRFSDREELSEKLVELLRDGDTILVKASHFMAFDKIVEKIQGL